MAKQGGKSVRSRRTDSADAPGAGKCGGFGREEVHTAGACSSTHSTGKHRWSFCDVSGTILGSWVQQGTKQDVQPAVTEQEGKSRRVGGGSRGRLGRTAWTTERNLGFIPRARKSTEGFEAEMRNGLICGDGARCRKAGGDPGFRTLGLGLWL